MSLVRNLVIITGLLVFLISIFGLSFVAIYNGLVSANQNVDEKWSQVENQYQRRADLIPNLVQTVKGYAAHEREVFEEVTRARSQWGEAKTRQEKIDAAGGLDSAISRLLLVVENYPQLKANENFISLQAQLEGTENRITVARMDYNEAVKSYNVKIRSIPSNVIADMFGYQDRPYFEAEEGSERVPVVNFTN